jgi:alkyl hydroperoxide reductase subunit AhpF
MPFLKDTDRADLKRRFQKELKNDVTLKLFTQAPSLLTIPGRPECQTCGDTQALLEELTSLSPKLHLEVHDFYREPDLARSQRVARIPGLVLGTDGDSRLKYYGIPAGYEFVTILEGIITLSRGVSPLKLESRKQLRKVNQPVHIQVFVTPT